MGSVDRGTGSFEDRIKFTARHGILGIGFSREEGNSEQQSSGRILLVESKEFSNEHVRSVDNETHCCLQCCSVGLCFSSRSFHKRP